MPLYAYRLETKRIKEPDFPYHGSEPLSSPAAVAAFVHNLQNSDIEKMMVLFLNAKNRLTCLFTQPGTVGHTAIYPREIAKHALLSGATSVILVHNHPSGDPEPSPEDKAITNSIKTALKLFQIEVLDHIVIGDNCHISFRENGILSLFG